MSVVGATLTTEEVADVGTYGPHDTWPEHPKQWWRETLAYARERGWSLEYPSGHWGRIRCPGECVALIFSTGRSGESAAITTRRKIERCRHVDGSTVARVLHHLDSAERLTDAADELLSRVAHLADVEEMLSRADEALDAIDEARLLDEIDGLEGPVDADQVAVALDDAGSHLDQAAQLLPALSKAGSNPHRRRLGELRARIRKLRSRLEARPPNVIEFEGLRETRPE